MYRISKFEFSGPRPVKWSHVWPACRKVWNDGRSLKERFYALFFYKKCDQVQASCKGLCLAEREQSEIRLHNIWCNFFYKQEKWWSPSFIAGLKRIKMKLAFTTCGVKQKCKCNLNQFSTFRGESCGRTDLQTAFIRSFIHCARPPLWSSG
jgi:hypothetical protein